VRAVVGLMGRIGSGKGTVADVLINEFGFKGITMGDLAREEVTDRGLEPSRETTTRISTELLSKDPAYFIKKAVKKINESGHDKWLIDGIRTPINITGFRKAFPNIVFIKVEVKPEIRFERMRLRGRPGFPSTFEKFMEHEQLEDQKFHLSETLSKADQILNNNGTYEELTEKTRVLAEKLF